MSDSWQALLDTYGNTEEELDALFDQPWPGQTGYVGSDDDNLEDQSDIDTGDRPTEGE